MATTQNIVNRVAIKDNDTGNNAEVVDNKLQVKADSMDFRLMISYQAKILEQLEKLNLYMEIITEEEL